MKRQTFSNRNTFFAILFILLIFGCSKNNNTLVTPVTHSATISGIDINFGPYNTVVTISGTNFSTVTTQDQVWFNNVIAVVKSATATQLQVLVPIGAGTGTITLTVNGAVKITGPVFTYQPTFTVSTLAGNGISNTGSLLQPTGIAVDQAGNLYITDSGDNQIKMLTSSGAVSTFAGTGVSGYKDGAGNVAQFIYPTGISIDANGNIYTIDGTVNCYLRKITNVGVVSTISGTSYVTTMTSDSKGNIYMGSTSANLVYKFSPTTGISSINLQNASAVGPNWLAVDAAGNLYATINSRVFQISPGGVLTTIAAYGVNPITQKPTNTIATPNGIAIDGTGNLYVTDTNSNKIYEITTDGNVALIAGAGTYDMTDGNGATATFRHPKGIWVNTAGTLIYVVDSDNSAIRKIVVQ